MNKLGHVLLGAFVVLLVGCSNDDAVAPTGGGFGTLILRMTDSPVLYDSVVVAVDSVQAHLSTGDSTSGWFTINRIPARYDLLILANGNDTIVGTATLPAGVYSQIRLYIGAGSYVVIGGVHFPLTISSGSQSGLKLNVHTEIQANVVYSMTLDFDAARSIVLTGAGQYMLKPVIRVITTEQTGNIGGTIMPGSARAQIWAFTSTDTASTMADTTGSFRLSYLSPGSYIVSILPTNPTYRDTTINGVMVTAGNTTALGTIVLNTQ